MRETEDMVREDIHDAADTLWYLLLTGNPHTDYVADAKVNLREAVVRFAPEWDDDSVDSVSAVVHNVYFAGGTGMFDYDKKVRKLVDYVLDGGLDAPAR